ncbi:hypothetical protein FSW04_17680 [Baekduia soli]|uniref:Uncharacterized protein n=1 Tax=Baekduia soli TaxID=496014 RepID=A0A5B8U7Z2_9ACTN|nr:hypothetical protein [Baekduia soli]QEC49229.1 hypothetical protein FSW04_17680 [Baekduia soli]
MATITRTFTKPTRGDSRFVVAEVVFSSSYTTGGEPLTLAQLGLESAPAFVISSIKVAGAGAATEVYFDVPSLKLLAYTATAEVANATNLSGVTVQLVAFTG